MWHVGHLYRIGDLIEQIEDNSFTMAELFGQHNKYKGVEVQSIMDLSFKCEWLTKNKDKIHVTSAGFEIVSNSDPEARLQAQIRSMMQYTCPKWVSAFPRGRKAFALYAPQEAVQCFSEAGILESLDLEIIEWWDMIAGLQRHKGQSGLIQTGRYGEKWSFRYEECRIGRKPTWTAVQTGDIGYDILSWARSDLIDRLLIEVKATQYGWNEARFHITRYEWDILKDEPRAVIHLWSFAKRSPEMAVVQVEALTEQCPSDGEEGKWESFVCPFNIVSPYYGVEMETLNNCITAYRQVD